MNATKISLSPQQMELVLSADLILTKNAIIEKAKWLLEELQHTMITFIAGSETAVPPEILIPPPKISKGENYQGLPYLVLDYPRHFQKENIFVIRCMFWWGNFFSITLHVTGNYKTRVHEVLLTSYNSLSGKGFYLCINEKEWEHHFDPANYKAIADMNTDQFSQYITASTFIKVARRYSLTNWDCVQELLMADFEFLIKICHS